MLNAGTGRNVVPANAVLKFETRANNTAVSQYMHEEATRIIKASAEMYDVNVTFSIMGQGINCESDAVLVERVKYVATTTGIFNDILPTVNFGGGENCTFLMKRVQECGGQANYIIIGTELADGHHNSRFDFNEDAMLLGVILLSNIVEDILGH